MCLCGILGAESQSLPENVSAEAARFFRLNIHWLAALYESADPNNQAEPAEIRAMRTMATLEGAMIVARNVDDPDAFDHITKPIPGDSL